MQEFDGVSVECQRSIVWYQNAPWERLASMYLVWFIYAVILVFNSPRDALLSYLGLKIPFFTFSELDFSALKLLNH